MTDPVWVPQPPVSTREVVPSTLPVDLPTDTYREAMRIVVPAAAGDRLDITAMARVTNDCGYTVGVGWHLWWYDCDPEPDANGIVPPTATRTRVKISPSMGDNVPASRHHLPLHISSLYTVPDTWPEGHRMVVLLRVDAHSTAWQAGDTLTFDKAYAELIVRRWAKTSP